MVAPMAAQGPWRKWRRFFGTASASDFTVAAGGVSYGGPVEWSYRRFILHQAALCAAAGGIEAFCIGSEMRGLTQIRGVSGFAAVQALIALAAECRTIWGGGNEDRLCRRLVGILRYNAPGGDRYFHLDPLWADDNIDFIGIDNYMPLSDWRDGQDHADADWGAIYNLDYLQANVAGGKAMTGIIIRLRRARRRSERRSLMANTASLGMAL